MDWLEFNASNAIVVDGGGMAPQAMNQWEHTSQTFTTGATTTSLIIRLLAENAVRNAFADGIKLNKFPGGN